MEKIFNNQAPVNKEKMIEELMEDTAINRFLFKNDIASDEIEMSLNRLLSYKIESDYCKNCRGLHECKQDISGYKPVLAYKNGKIELIYNPCQFQLIDQELHQKDLMIDALYMPKMILEADLSDYDYTRGNNRLAVFNAIMKFMDDYAKNEYPKGLYIHGEYQKGKTYILGAIANELTKQGRHVIIAYYPDLVRELKSRISNNSLESMISKLKQADVLMLDDIGGEAYSAWIRDEVLGPILQHRLLDKLPTFFTSNVSQKDLMKYMMGNAQKSESMKAARIFARIHSLSTEVEL